MAMAIGSKLAPETRVHVSERVCERVVFQSPPELLFLAESAPPPCPPFLSVPSIMQAQVLKQDQNQVLRFLLYPANTLV